MLNHRIGEHQTERPNLAFTSYRIIGKSERNQTKQDLEERDGILFGEEVPKRIVIIGAEVVIFPQKRHLPTVQFDRIRRAFVKPWRLLQQRSGMSSGSSKFRVE